MFESEAGRPDWRRLYDTAAGQEGLFTARQASEAGYSPQLLVHHVRSGKVLRVRRGIYRLVHFPAGDHEELVSAWLWSEQAGVLSHQTALALHELSDSLPAHIHLTLPTDWRRRRFRVPPGVVLHHADVPPEDRAWFGSVPVTTVRRTLNDCAREGLSPELLQQATQQAIRRGLVAMAELPAVDSALRPFGEQLPGGRRPQTPLGILPGGSGERSEHRLGRGLEGTISGRSPGSGSAPARSDLQWVTGGALLSIIDYLRQWQSELSDLLGRLESASALTFHPVNRPGDVVLILGRGDYPWVRLAGEGPMVQRQLLDEFERFRDLCQALLRNRPGDVRHEFEEANRAFLFVVEQQDAAYEGETKKYFDNARKAVARIVERLAEAYPARAREAVLVPDTNALLHNLALETWRIADVSKILVVLTPPVLDELDKLKVGYPKPEVREKAERMIRQIKEYRRRGTLRQGVPLAVGYSRIATSATEPKVKELLPWLDPASSDDRLLAAFIEIMREYAAHPVALVTRDINLQNKADHARVPFIEPPDPGQP